MSQRTLRVVRAVYLAVAAALIAWLIATRWDDLTALVAGTRIVWLLATLILSFGLLAWSSLIWAAVTRAVASPVGFLDLVRAAARSVLGRYIPGSVWYAVGRVALLTTRGVPAPPLALAATAEMALSIAVTIGVGALVLGAAGALPGGSLIQIAGAVAVVAAGAPPIGGRILHALAARRGIDLPPMSWAGYLSALGAVGLYWGWAALTFSVYLRAFPSADGFDVLEVAGGFLFSWGVGFLAFVAPQGVGVFEVTLASILATDGIATVALVIGGYRLVILVRDVIAAILGELTASAPAGRPSASTD